MSYITDDPWPISIHAPAKGATCFNWDRGTSDQISIHAPAKGATCVLQIFGPQAVFQSTLPRRERLAHISHVR